MKLPRHSDSNWICWRCLVDYSVILGGIVSATLLALHHVGAL